MITITERREMIKITTMAIMRMNYGNGNEGSKI